MTKRKKQFKSIDEYISVFPKSIQDNMNKLRHALKEAVPEAEETISYQIPTYKLKGNLVHFAAFKNHKGFYPTPSAIRTLEKNCLHMKLQKVPLNFQ